MSDNNDTRGGTTPAGGGVTTKQEFGRRLSALIAERGWNQSELARQASRIGGFNVGRDAISTYIRGRSLPEPRTLTALAKALGTSPESLIPHGRHAVMTADEPMFQISMTADPGMVWMRMNLKLTFEQARQIMELVDLRPEDEGEVEHGV